MKHNEDESNNFFSIFTGLDKLINVVADMVDKDKDEVNIQGDIKPDNRKITGKYGFHVKLSPDRLEGISGIDLNNIIKKADNPPKTVAPVTDVFEEEDRIIIVSELPGVEQEDIELNLERNAVIFTAVKKDVCYSKRIELAFVPDYSLVSESFHNSIYSVTIEKNKQK